ncbi:unnamed protein product, partial [Didymodactylos carnosus]
IILGDFLESGNSPRNLGRGGSGEKIDVEACGEVLKRSGEGVN